MNFHHSRRKYKADMRSVQRAAKLKKKGKLKREYPCFLWKKSVKPLKYLPCTLDDLHSPSFEQINKLSRNEWSITIASKLNELILNNCAKWVLKLKRFETLLVFQVFFLLLWMLFLFFPAEEHSLLHKLCNFWTKQNNLGRWNEAVDGMDAEGSMSYVFFKKRNKQICLKES